MRTLFPLYRVLPVALALAVATGGTVLAAGDHTYQVTGTVQSVSPTSIEVVDKSGVNWKVSRDAGTQVTSEPAVGAKVLIKYHAVADKITVKK